MGNEANCRVRLGARKARGRALLETSELIFRSEDSSLRWKVAFSGIKSAQATDGELHLQTAEGPAVFELGANAAKWCEKILHPKSRMEKLGVKSGDAVCLLGKFDDDFLSELNATTRSVTSGKMAGTPDCIFFAADSSKDLAPLAKLAKSMKGAAALWIAYPKGQKHITENEVLAAGRKTGLKDVKVVGFSPTHTALKFVIPLEKR